MNAVLIYFEFYMENKIFAEVSTTSYYDFLENAMPKSNNCWLSFLRRSSCSEIVAPIELVRLCTTWANLARRSASIYNRANFDEKTDFSD